MMKTSKFRNTALVISFLAISGIAASCTQELLQENEHQENNEYLVDVIIPAGFDESTGKGDFKAEFAEPYPSIHWKKDDKIAVLGTNTGKQTFTALSNGKSTDFQGKIDTRDNIVYAIYPYDDAVSLPTQSEINNSQDQSVEIMNVTVPATQFATAGSFDSNAYVALAKSDGTSFTFRAACSFMKFNFTKDGNDVNSVKIVANNNGGNTVTIAGTAGVKFYSSGIPSHGVGKTWVTGTGTNTITLCEKDGHNFSNDTFYIVTRANTCPAGITVFVEYEDGSVYTKSSSSQVFPSGNDRNSIINLGNFDKENGFECTVSGVSLLDYSFAGYRYSEEAPIEINPEELVHGNVTSTGHKVYDVTKYGAIANDGEPDRIAFLAAVNAALGNVGYVIDGNGWYVFNHKNSANAVVYFPEGEYILHTSADDVEGRSQSIQIRTSNFIIKGAGRDKTKIIMQDPNQPASSALYSSPDMIQLKHNSTHGSKVNINVAADSPKGSHSLTLESVSGLAVDQWVCLYISSKDKDLLAEQTSPYTAEETWNIYKNGVEVIDYHKIKSIEGNKVTFYEPIMTEVKAKYGWALHDFPNYENIGIEDLTFKGNAKNNFVHHGSWQDDGAFKPISLQRITNSWIRRVGFESTSEACSIIYSANISAYDITMTGTNGHSAIRSQASSRVLIADTQDNSDNGGHFHGVGVSRQSIGTVLWRNTWGDNSCFESHASQPRATLIDCCEGGWHRFHAGGDKTEAPHHLADLVIWNFSATTIGESNFSWWGDPNHNFLPPVISGFNGAVTFENAIVINDSYDGESLFENQLKKRLGFVPGWLLELKNN
jgi:hypothetical protein